MRDHLRDALAVLVLVTVTPRIVAAQDVSIGSEQAFARGVFEELIEINTVRSTTEAAEAMAAHLRAAGFPEADIDLLGPVSQKTNLVARFRGSGSQPPLLLLAHLDVVEALPEDWSFDPFVFREQDGYFYGRGTTDDKAQAAIWVANLIRLKQEGFTPNRDIIVALTADEEGGDYNGVNWLVRNHRDLVDAAYALNEGGGGLIKDERNIINAVQATEKVYRSFRLEVTNPGGHSSVPTKDNAIYHLAEALARLAAFDFPVKLNEVTTAYFQRMSRLETGRAAADLLAVTQSRPDPDAIARVARNAYYNALLRTTCVATRLEGGHADNALPQVARAVVNCRMLPNDIPSEVENTLRRVLADDEISVTPMNDPQPSPPSPLTPEVMRPVEAITAAMWPGVEVIPVMLTGATDGLYLRNAGIPTYGVSGLFGEMDDIRAHGRDERIGVRAFYEGYEFLYRLVKALSSEGTS